MKHLKRYNEELTEKVLTNNIKQNIKDICLELNDIGISSGFHYNINAIDHLNIFKPKNQYTGDFFTYTYEISEVIERIKDYMSKEGFIVVTRGDNGTLEIDKKYWEIDIYFLSHLKYMKYLKSYHQPIISGQTVISNQVGKYNENNIEKLPDDVRGNIKDILLELNDLGFDERLSRY
jgi:hypothetical protein